MLLNIKMLIDDAIFIHFGRTAFPLDRVELENVSGPRDQTAPKGFQTKCLRAGNIYVYIFSHLPDYPHHRWQNSAGETKFSKWDKWIIRNVGVYWYTTWHSGQLPASGISQTSASGWFGNWRRSQGKRIIISRPFVTKEDDVIIFSKKHVTSIQTAPWWPKGASHYLIRGITAKTNWMAIFRICGPRMPRATISSIVPLSRVSMQTLSINV